MGACAVALSTRKRRIHRGAQGVVQGGETVKQAGICPAENVQNESAMTFAALQEKNATRA
jgi:hypothetical protein